MAENTTQRQVILDFDLNASGAVHARALDAQWPIA